MYPTIHDKNLTHKTLNVKATSISQNHEQSAPISVMWTSCKGRFNNIWTPDHFVPVLDLNARDIVHDSENESDVNLSESESVIP